MSAEQILSLFQWDHYPIRHEDGGLDEPWNLTPLFIMSHREKTAKVDAPEAAKGRHIRAKLADSANRMLEKYGVVLTVTTSPKLDRVLGTQKKPRRRSRIPSRPFDKRRRPMRVRDRAPGLPRRP